MCVTMRNVSRCDRCLDNTITFCGTWIETLRLLEQCIDWVNKIAQRKWSASAWTRWIGIVYGKVSALVWPQGAKHTSQFHDHENKHKPTTSHEPYRSCRLQQSARALGIKNSFDEGVSCSCLQMLEKMPKGIQRKQKRESKRAKREPKWVK